jgi:uncharacterized repeat protein (TIGR03803 family)
MRRIHLILIALVGGLLLFSSLLARGQCTRSCGIGGSPTGTGGPQFLTLYTFKSQADAGNSQAPLIEDATGALYGTSKVGGTANLGTVFKLESSGIETILHSFTGSPDGTNPLASLLLDSAGNLFGTTSGGGTMAGSCASSGCGVIFKIDPAGKETAIYTFAGMLDGASPKASLMQDSSGNLYGTTANGGSSSSAGTVFKLDTTGKETVLHSFSDVPDGADPLGSLLLDPSGTIYGTTSGGGTLNCNPNPHPGSKPTVGCGTVFSLSLTGTESVLYSFAGSNEGPDGAFPTGGLVRDLDGDLYGATLNGGHLCYIIPMMAPEPSTLIYCGTVFKIGPTGKEALLHVFDGADGAVPNGDLVLDSAGNLYGTTSLGGTGNCYELGTGLDSSPVDVGCGTIFKIDSTGKEVVEYSFQNNQSDGTFPHAGLMLGSDGNLYGTTSSAGAAGYGTIFRFTPSNTPIFTLSVALAGSGTGVVTSNPVGITCGAGALPQCSANFDGGTTITLTASPDSDSTLASWSGACTGAGTCSLTLSANESVTATFNLLPPDFSVSAASSALTLQPGAQQTDTITIAPQNGPFATAVQL